MLSKSIIIFFSFAFQLVAIHANCSIHSFGKIVKANDFNHADAQRAIKDSDCPAEKLQSFRNRIVKGEGTLRSGHFQGIDLHPPKIDLVSLDDLVAKNIFKQKNWYFKNSKIVTNNKAAFYLNSGESLHINHCKNCRKTGEKNIKVQILSPAKGRKRAVWVKGDILIKAKGLVLKENSGAGMGQLSSQQFVWRDVFTKNPQKLFTNLSEISFYKLNRSKNTSAPIYQQDLVPIRLVSPGRPAQIVLLNNGIKLSGQALPLNSGKFGEVIRLRNNKTKNIIVGKVVDFNKVVVQL